MVVNTLSPNISKLSAHTVHFFTLYIIRPSGFYKTLLQLYYGKKYPAILTLRDLNVRQNKGFDRSF